MNTFIEMKKSKIVNTDLLSYQVGFSLNDLVLSTATKKYTYRGNKLIDTSFEIENSIFSSLIGCRCKTEDEIGQITYNEFTTWISKYEKQNTGMG